MSEIATEDSTIRPLRKGRHGETSSIGVGVLLHAVSRMKVPRMGVLTFPPFAEGAGALRHTFPVRSLLLEGR
jgi:hypothetical protein